MEAPQLGHYWKTPFYWESDCAAPPRSGSLKFETPSDQWLRDAIVDVMQNATDDSDKYAVSKVGGAAAVQELFDLQPRYFSRPPTWWRLARDKTNRPVAFVLPVLFKEDRFWKDGRPQGTIFYMGVLPEFRGLGYGLELVHEATRLFIEANCWRVFCDTGTENAPMIATFRRAGYAERKPWQRPLE